MVVQWRLVPQTSQALYDSRARKAPQWSCAHVRPKCAPSKFRLARGGHWAWRLPRSVLCLARGALEADQEGQGQSSTPIKHIAKSETLVNKQRSPFKGERALLRAHRSHLYRAWLRLPTPRAPGGSCSVPLSADGWCMIPWESSTSRAPVQTSKPLRLGWFDAKVAWSKSRCARGSAMCAGKLSEIYDPMSTEDRKPQD